ncbi:SLC13A5 [Branchiostoma lanceolatum]|uniref:SLC13A5 protein n=1 Tax=Branchiostoma lanceolatum TaxID=7740 RepID=A0A8K0EPW2_BRALA|nr:SLC13A5 [Branchiostoma lanceolatum]
MAYRVLRELWAFRTSLVFWLVPLVFCPLPIYYAWTDFYTEAACGYVVIIMAFYWSCEVVPIGVTSLLPVVLLPALGIQSARDVCSNYMTDVTMLFIGGLMLAAAVQRWNLHKRFALRALMLFGTEPKWLMLGFMSVSAFLSMWISNTATTAMMAPVASAMLDEMRQEEEDENGTSNDLELQEVKTDDPSAAKERRRTTPIDDTAASSVEVIVENKEPAVVDEKTRRRRDRRDKGLLLCVCQAANIGGIASLTGTSPNLVCAREMDAQFPDGPGIDFATWFFFGFPTMVLCLVLAWLCLSFMYFGCSLCTGGCSCCQGRGRSRRQDAITKAYAELGPMTFAEGASLFHFVLMVLLWFFRDLRFISLDSGRAAGWTYFFVPGYFTDGAVCITVAFALFFFPSERPRFICCRPSDDERTGPVPALLDWRSFSDRMPWFVPFIFGGGIALAGGVTASGLATWLGDQFSKVDGLPDWVLLLVMCAAVAAFTEFATNSSGPSILLPILARMAERLCINPYYLMVPASISASFSFMLPVATMPNAIIYSYGKLTVLDMMKSGIWLNVLCLLVLMLTTHTLGIAVYGVDTFPSWATCLRDGATSINTTMVTTQMT